LKQVCVTIGGYVERLNILTKRVVGDGQPRHVQHYEKEN
jgi:hypothetical protein